MNEISMIRMWHDRPCFSLKNMVNANTLRFFYYFFFLFVVIAVVAAVVSFAVTVIVVAAAVIIHSNSILPMYKSNLTKVIWDDWFSISQCTERKNFISLFDTKTYKYYIEH